MTSVQKVLLAVIISFILLNLVLVLGSFDIPFRAPFHRPEYELLHNIESANVRVSTDTVKNFFNQEEVLDYQRTRNSYDPEKKLYPNKIIIQLTNTNNNAVISNIKNIQGLRALGYGYTTNQNNLIISFFIHEEYITNNDSKTLKADLNLLMTEAFLELKRINEIDGNNKLTQQDRTQISKEILSLTNQYEFVETISK